MRTARSPPYQVPLAIYPPCESLATSTSILSFLSAVAGTGMITGCRVATYPAISKRMAGMATSRTGVCAAFVFLSNYARAVHARYVL